MVEHVRPIYLQIPGEMTVDPVFELDGFRERVATVSDFRGVVTAVRELLHDDGPAALLEAISPAASAAIPDSATCPDRMVS